MNRGKKWNTIILIIFAVQWLWLSGCGGQSLQSVGTEKSAGVTVSQAYSIPEMKQAEFHANQASKTGPVEADFSALAEGYVAMAVTCDKPLKFQVIHGADTYNYDLDHNGTPSIFPLNMGDGSYQFRVMENVSGNKYAQLWTETKDVTLEDEFQPFLRPNQVVHYQESSACVALAVQLAEGCETDVEVVSAIYDYLVNHIAYDQEKADTVKQGYLPKPDQTLQEEKGICFDYAALAAAMLRGVGIPCKLVTGYMGAEEVYHAWNTIYLKNQGWITVQIEASAEDWNRIDTTLAAGGTGLTEEQEQLIYTTRYLY